jgi:hypothetical protein
MLKSAKRAAPVVNLRRVVVWPRWEFLEAAVALPTARARVSKGKPLVISLAGPKAVAGFPRGWLPARPAQAQPRASNVQDVVAVFLRIFNTQLY